MTNISEKLKERFCKDNNVTIQLFAEPYFTQRLKLFDKYDLYLEFCDVVEKLGGEQPFFEYYNKLRDNIIDYIKASTAYNLLQNYDFTKKDASLKELLKDANCTKQVGQGDVYKYPNIGKTFLSIDIAKANFTALVSFSKEIDGSNLFNDGSLDWNVFISRFTDIPYFAKSKYIRQVVFGNCNPKRQVHWESLITDSLRADINCACGLDSKIVTKCNDELVYEVDYDEYLNIKNALSGTYYPLHFNFYKVLKATNTDAFVLQVLSGDDQGKYIIKGAGPVESIFVKRALNGEDTTEEDLLFQTDHNRLARLVKPIKVEIISKENN